MRQWISWRGVQMTPVGWPRGRDPQCGCWREEGVWQEAPMGKLWEHVRCELGHVLGCAHPGMMREGGPRGWWDMSPSHGAAPVCCLSWCHTSVLLVPLHGEACHWVRVSWLLVI
eukprot:109029-Prymnesium_polylepis.1